MSDTLARGACSNGLDWEIQSWSEPDVTLEFVDAQDRNESYLLTTFTRGQAHTLANALHLTGGGPSVAQLRSLLRRYVAADEGADNREDLMASDLYLEAKKLVGPDHE